MSAFITDGDQRSSLAVVRALGSAGIATEVGFTSVESLAGVSRWATARHVYPCPRLDPREFQRWVVASAGPARWKVIFPMTDITAQLVAEIKPQLPASCVGAIPDSSIVLGVQDKLAVLRTGENLGIASPKTYLVSASKPLEEIAASLRYPVVIKPRFSKVLADDRWSTGNVRYANNAAELLERYRTIDSVNPGPLIQELVEGEGRGVFLLLWNGELKSAFCHRRLREKPAWGGVSTYRDSVPLDPEIVDRSLALLRALRWNGVAMVEYKRRSADGLLHLMEINGRFWGSLQLASDAGLNMPAMLYKLCLNNEVVASSSNYRVGVKSRWLLGDLDSLWTSFRTPRNTPGLPSAPRIGQLLEFLHFFERDCCYEVWRWNDRSPGWLELKEYLQALVRRRDR
jgi:predicted ATP-grasp superfamily ATP-dependent carboligase